MIKRNDYIFGFVTAFLLLMMLSATPPTPAGQYSTNTLEEQKKVYAVDNAVQNVLNDGLRTKDIMSKNKKEVSTSQMGDAIVNYLK